MDNVALTTSLGSNGFRQLKCSSIYYQLHTHRQFQMCGDSLFWRLRQHACAIPHKRASWGLLSVSWDDGLWNAAETPTAMGLELGLNLGVITRLLWFSHLTSLGLNVLNCMITPSKLMPGACLDSMNPCTENIWRYLAHRRCAWHMGMIQTSLSQNVDYKQK